MKIDDTWRAGPRNYGNKTINKWMGQLIASGDAADALACYLWSCEGSIARWLAEHWEEHAKQLAEDIAAVDRRIKTVDLNRSDVVFVEEWLLMHRAKTWFEQELQNAKSTAAQCRAALVLQPEILEPVCLTVRQTWHG